MLVFSVAFDAHQLKFSGFFKVMEVFFIKKQYVSMSRTLSSETSLFLGPDFMGLVRLSKL